MSIAIKFENISKQYRLGTIGTGTLSHDLNRWWHLVRGKEDPYLKIGQENDRSKKAESEYVWALKDVSFDINKGDVVGIIGKNGAGKSTLLKILSRITRPTTGDIKAQGRIASLLEVGTGFHPEMTGRENIYLNGAIMGMTKQEITKKLDEIVDFAGVEKYIDTPAKRYSSGMVVRLGFAIAAHLEPEILVVDEVLAVGDAEFQKKAIGKMKDVSKGEGRTVLFVSHNMASIKQLCTRGVVLGNEKVEFKGTQTEAITYYQSSNKTNNYFEHTGNISEAPGNNDIRILKFSVLPLHGDVISISSGICFELTFYNRRNNINLDATFELKTVDEQAVFHNGPLITTNKDSKEGIYKVTGKIEPNILNAGAYKFNLIFGENQRILLYKIDDFLQFEILNEAKGSNTMVSPGILKLNNPYEVDFQNLHVK
ncbi:MAG: ATP-binding cassette domain-containing protein [Candidatus Azobacteroides sp.]|nr:ATP-binding cassette domain-containing protein [Candidatus Azobacteroides sp.]